jgi:hypothetical protein
MAVTLYFIGLDIKYTPLTPGILLFTGSDTFRDWFRITHEILMSECKDPQTLEEVSETYEETEEQF